MENDKLIIPIEEVYGEMCLNYGDYSKAFVKWLKRQYEFFPYITLLSTEVDIDERFLNIGSSNVRDLIVSDISCYIRYALNWALIDPDTEYDVEFDNPYRYRFISQYSKISAKYRDRDVDVISKITKGQLCEIYTNIVKEYSGPSCYHKNRIIREKFKSVPTKCPWTMKELMDLPIYDTMAILIDAIEDYKTQV